MTTLSSTLPSTVNLTNSTAHSFNEKTYNRAPISSGGRSINSVKHFVGAVCSQTARAAQKVLSTAGSVVSDPNALASVFRRLNCQVIDAFEQVRKIPSSLSKFRGASDSFVGFLDAVQFFGDADYFLVQKKYLTDSRLKVTAHVAGCVANVGGTLLWLQELSFINLSKMAKTLGEVRLFGKVPQIIKCVPVVRDMPRLMHAAASLGKVRVFSILNELSVGLIAGRALTLYYLFSALDSLKRVTQSGTPSDKTQAGLDLSYYSSELALNALFVVGVASTTGIGVLGATCIATGLASFTYKNYK